MNACITLETLRKTIAKLKEYEIPPRTVMTRNEASEFTKNDPAGRRWRVGDKYYLVVEDGGRWAIAP